MADEKKPGVETVPADGPLAWNHNAVAIRMELPPIPTPEEWEAQVRERRAHAHTALQRATEALAVLRALPGALGAVARHHSPAPEGDPYDRWGCRGCDGCERAEWPCSTVDVIAEELGIVLPNPFHLPAADPEPLDAPIPPVPTRADNYFYAVPRPASFVNLTDTD